MKHGVIQKNYTHLLYRRKKYPSVLEILPLATCYCSQNCRSPAILPWKIQCLIYYEIYMDFGEMQDTFLHEKTSFLWRNCLQTVCTCLIYNATCPVFIKCKFSLHVTTSFIPDQKEKAYVPTDKKDCMFLHTYITL